MVNIAIIGARDAEYLIEQIRQSTVNWNVVCIGDNATQINGKTIQNVIIKKVDDVIALYQKREIDKIIIAVRKGYSRYCLLKQIKTGNVKSEDIVMLKPSPLTYHQPIVFNNTNKYYGQHWMNFGEMENIGRTIIHHLETHVADGCNLNCKGCLHFSNLYGRDEMPDLNEILENVKHINCHFSSYNIICTTRKR